ncbi:MAG: type 1 glutamine amidotransferase [Actinomycetes bacterium]
MQILVVEHEAGCSADRFAGWLADAGAELVVCRPYLGDVVPERVAGAGLVVLGGHMGALDDDDHPWLPVVRSLLARSVREGVPVLGICLGAQLLAAGCGGRVEVGARGIEAGVVDVRWRAEAAYDALVAGLPAPFPGPSMHRDAVTALPPGAIWLGETDAYPHQVFRVGDCAWGVQFHPEVSLASFAAWRERVSPQEWTRYGVDGRVAVDELRVRDAEVAAAGRELASRFAALARARVLQPSSR